jgi:DNA-binding response OmpR family regulator
MTNIAEPGRTALVVDDDPAILEVLVEILDEAGFATTTFDRGLPALAALAERHFDVLLVDQWLPDINGIRICAAAQEAGTTGAILMITADSRVERHITALTLGADDVVAKPFHVDMLLARIEAKLRSKSKNVA